MLCVRECPAWCISLTAENRTDETATAGGGRKPRTTLVLTEFHVDYALCMYCGICVDVCPFDCLTWDADSTPAATARGDLDHGIVKLASGDSDDEAQR